MDFQHYIGIDIAKDTLDWAAFNQQGVLLRIHTPNTVTGIQTALRQLKQLDDWGKAVFCMEHTGIFNALKSKRADRLPFK